MILVSYDGSADSEAAIDRAAQLMPGAETTVLTVWEPFLDAVTRNGSLGIGMGMAGGYGDDEKIDEASRQAALSTATAGAERATAAGLVARPRCAARRGGVANTIVAAAADEDADVIVLGTRGLSGVKSFLLGSVSHAVAQHADRPVLVAPSPGVAARRREWAGLEAAPV
jgi:nucleotide-binding universal stress UspA family protein